MSQGPTIGDEPDQPGAVGLALLMSDTEAAITAAAGEIAMLSRVAASGFGQPAKLVATLSPAPTAGPAPKTPLTIEPPSDAPPPATLPSVAPSPGTPPPPASSRAVPPSGASSKPAVAVPATLPRSVPVAMPVAQRQPASVAPVPAPTPAPPESLPAALPTPSSPPLPQRAAAAGVAATLRWQALPASVAPAHPTPSVAAAQQATAPIDYALFAPQLPVAAAVPPRTEIISSEMPVDKASFAASGPSILAQSALAPSAAQSPPDAGGTAAATARAVSPSLAPTARRAEAGGSSAQGGSGPTHGDVFLDGARVGRWMSDTLARAVSGPSSGSTAFDPQMSAAWPGALQGH